MDVSCKGAPITLTLFIIHNCYTLAASIPLQSHYVSSNDTLFYHLDVNCDGTESILSECNYYKYGAYHCLARKEEAGVICKSEYLPFIFM